MGRDQQICHKVELQHPQPDLMSKHDVPAVLVVG
jgi:hypothetical protein